MNAGVALLMLFGACPTPPGSAGIANNRPSPTPAVSSDAALAGDQAMIQLIHELIALSYASVQGPVVPTYNPMEARAKPHFERASRDLRREGRMQGDSASSSRSRSPPQAG